MAVDKNTISKEAQKYVAKGQFDKAIAEWKKLLKETPDDPNIYNTIGDLCLKKEARTDAVDAYKTAADMLATDGFTSKAIALYKKILNIDMNRVDVHLALGEMNAEKGLTGNALENYKYVADYYVKNNKMAEALGIYQKMADMSPANALFRVKLADMYAKEGMKPEAIKAYLAAADIHVSKGVFQDARQLFEKILTLDPGNKEVYHKAGVVYFKEGKFVEACKALKPAFESDPSNQELTGMYLEALANAGKGADAEEAYRKILKHNPDMLELREKLFTLYLAKKEFEKALAEASLLADASVKIGNPAAAEKVLKAVVSAQPGFVQARKGLAAFYISLDQTRDAARELVQAANILVETGDREGAKDLLERALELDPGMPEAEEQLAHIAPPPPPPPPPPPAPPKPQPPVAAPPEPELSAPELEPIEIEEPPQAVFPGPEPELFETPPPATAATPAAEEDPSIVEAFTEADVLIKYGLAEKAMEQLESLVSRFPENPRIRIKLRDLYHEQGNIDKAVRHALLAVALYTKYGSDDLAAAVLRSTRTMAPNHPSVTAMVARAAMAAAAAPVEPPPFEAPAIDNIPSLEPSAFEEAALPEILPDNLEIAEFPAAEENTLPAPPPTGEIEFDGLDAGIPHLETSLPADIPALQDMPVLDEALPAEAIAPATEIPQEPMEEILPEPAFPEELAPPVAETVQEPLAAAPVIPEPMEETVLAAAPAPQEAGQVPEETPSLESGINDLWAEAEFYFQQGLFDEARKLYTKIVGLDPVNSRAQNRLAELSREQEETQEFSKLADAVDDLESALTAAEAPGEMAISSSDEEAVRSLMREIQQLKEQEQAAAVPVEESIIAPPAPKAAAPAPPVAPAAPAPPVAAPAAKIREPLVPQAPVATPADDDYFDLGSELQADAKTAALAEAEDSSSDFFDLAAELRDELSSVPMPVKAQVPAEDQSLEDIFEEFKKGVETQAVKEDADTHYNLGVAYKEMGLLDDAIAEFIMTPEDESKFIQSRYMLGLCYMEKGEYRNAIGELQNALDYTETMGTDEDYHVGMHYDLGLAYQGAGNTDMALNEFTRVYKADPRYRDVASKIKEVKKGGTISLDQIKDDIEKEISSKFLEEGTRIGQEEKTKKNEKVKQ